MLGTPKRRRVPTAALACATRRSVGPQRARLMRSVDWYSAASGRGSTTDAGRRSRRESGLMQKGHRRGPRPKLRSPNPVRPPANGDGGGLARRTVTVTDGLGEAVGRRPGHAVETFGAALLILAGRRPTATARSASRRLLPRRYIALLRSAPACSGSGSSPALRSAGTRTPLGCNRFRCWRSSPEDSHESLPTAVRPPRFATSR
jgi:hypothetical protein